jgi:hypothetical protein
MEWNEICQKNLYISQMPSLTLIALRTIFVLIRI